MARTVCGVGQLSVQALDERAFWACGLDSRGLGDALELGGFEGLEPWVCALEGVCEAHCLAVFYDRC